MKPNMRVRQKNFRDAEVHEVKLEGLTIKLSVCKNDLGSIKEIYILADKQGTLINSFLDTISKLMSCMLQYGIPIEKIIHTCKGHNFEPKGIVIGHPYVETCDSILDLVAKILIKESEKL